MEILSVPHHEYQHNSRKLENFGKKKQFADFVFFLTVYRLVFKCKS